MMKSHFYVLRAKKLLVYGGTLLCMLLLILNSSAGMAALVDALLLCAQRIIPALFPFFVLSSFLVGAGFASVMSRLFSPLMKPLFAMSGAASLPFVMGILSGYPTGAKVTLELYLAGSLSKKEAERLLPLSNNAGPLFLMGAIGTGMLGQPRLGIFLYAIHLCSALLTGICLRFLPGTVISNRSPAKPQHTNTSLSVLLTDAIAKSVSTILNVCGFILFFSALAACLGPFLAKLPTPLSLGLQGFCEITGGAMQLINSGLPLQQVLCALSFFVGFGGLCVALQVAGILSGSGLSMKYYFGGKLIQGFWATFLCFLAYPLLPSDSLVCGSFGIFSNFQEIQRTIRVLFALFVVLILSINYNKKIPK